MNDFVKKNLWQLAVFVVGFAMAWALLGARVNSNENHIHEVQAKVDTLQTLVERVIVLEERESGIEADIAEIKVDLKLIKASINKL